MQESELRFSIEELAELVGLSVRTIRYYIAEGLLPGPGSRGKAAAYSEEHLLKLRLIRRLSEQHMPLAEMQVFLARLSVDEIRTLLKQEEQRSQELKQSAQEQTAKEYLAELLKNAQAARVQPSEEPSIIRERRPDPGYPQPVVPPGSLPALPPAPRPYVPTEPAGETWRRWELAPGVELHIRSDAEYQQRNLIERLFKAVGMIFRPFHR